MLASLKSWAFSYNLYVPWCPLWMVDLTHGTFITINQSAWHAFTHRHITHTFAAIRAFHQRKTKTVNVSTTRAQCEPNVYEPDNRIGMKHLRFYANAQWHCDRMWRGKFLSIFRSLVRWKFQKALEGYTKQCGRTINICWFFE